MGKFFYTYILQSQVDRNLYVGWTPDIKRRIEAHNIGLVQSTKSRKPFRLIFYEGFLSKKDAVLREKFFKTGWGRRHLSKALQFSLAG